MRKVRGEILKMEGLHTRQFTSSGGQVSASNTAAVQVFQIGDGATIANLGIVTAGSDEKVYLRSMHQRAVISNGTNCQLIVRCYKLQCRKNAQQTLVSYLNDSAPSYASRLIDPTTSPAFRRYFRITKRMTRRLAVADSMTLKLKRFYRSGKMITGDVETAFNFTPLTTVWLVCADTIPLESTDAAITVGVGLCKINWYQVTKYTYYLDEDNDPDTTLTETQMNSVTGQLFTDVNKTAEMSDQV